MWPRFEVLCRPWCDSGVCSDGTGFWIRFVLLKYMQIPQNHQKTTVPVVFNKDILKYFEQVVIWGFRFESEYDIKMKYRSGVSPVVMSAVVHCRPFWVE